jgi:hypothetical protein
MLKNNKLNKIIITLLLVSAGTLTAHAQYGLPRGGTDPDSAPDSAVAANYDHTKYYYMPDISVYFDVLTHEYIYASNNVWIHKSTLPARYHHVDIYHAYKVTVNQPAPWLHDEELAARYAHHRKRRHQELHAR